MKNSQIINQIAAFLKASAIHNGHSLTPFQRKKDRTDEIFEHYLLGEQASLNLGNRRKLRGRFMDNLTTSILLIDPVRMDMPSMAKEQHTIDRKLAAAKILRGHSLYDAAIMYVNDVYKRSVKHKLYEPQLECLKLLKEHAGTRIFNAKDFKTYIEEIKRVQSIVCLQDEAMECYGEMMLHVFRFRSNADLIYSVCEKALTRLSPHLSDCDSYVFQLATRLIRLNASSMKDDFLAMMNHTNDDVDYYLAQRPIHVFHLVIFLIQNIGACIRLGAYQEALLTIQKTENLVEPKNVNYFVLQYRKFLIYMHTAKYRKALYVYRDVVQKREFRKISSAMREDWDVGVAYLYYLSEVGCLPACAKISFNIEQFLKSVPEFSADKRAKNIPILVIHILYMLLRKDVNHNIEDRVDAISKYCSRYIRKDEKARSNTFIKILLQFQKGRFKKMSVVPRIKDLRKKLDSHQLHNPERKYDLEIVPYECLLSLALNSLR